MSVNVIYNLLGKLENIIITKGIRLLPFSYAIVNVQQIEETIDRIKVSLPGEIQEARELLKRKDELLIEAQNKADAIIYQAQNMANKMIDESEILKAVHSEAERIKKEVIEDCSALKRQTQEDIERARSNSVDEAMVIKEGAEKYAESILSNLDNDLTNLHEIVKNGQRQLSRMKAESLTKMTTIQGQNNSYDNVAQ